MRKLNKADSNRGGALLSVIIVMTVVGILGALVMSISYTNFRMKQIDKKSKDNFYSAEAVLDEISVGLQKEVSLQYKEAYTTVMENYGSYSSSAEMSEDFNTEFVLNMVESLKDGNDRTHYDFAKIENYVDSLNYPEGTYTITSTDKVLDTLTDGLCIRNLCVTYSANNGGYINTITTDIKISTPVVEFARISTMPEIADYIIIAQEGLKVGASNSAHWSLQGKAFAGAKKDDTGKITDSGIELSTGSTFDANNADATLLVTEGDILLNGSSNFRTGATTSLWANSVTASYLESAQNNPQRIANNTISLLGRSYIKDDITVSGKNNTLNLGGQYYGYSNNDADAAKSSAIIVNGSETTLDLSALKTFVVAGTSFVKPPIVADNPLVEGAQSPANVLMGDSVAVKSNQIAYMVPTECPGIVSNPMTYTQFDALIKKAEAEGKDWQEDALKPVLSTLGRSLASYGGVSIQPIYSNRDGGSVYLYLNFTDSDVASKYFMDYYGGTGGAKLKSYLERYVKSFTFNTDEMNRLVTQGNYLIPVSENGITYTDNTGDVATTAQELSNYLSSYEALCAKLVENKSSLDPVELNRTVYQNLIDQNGTETTPGTGKLDEFLKACADNSVGSAWSDNIIYDKTNKIATIWANAQDKTTHTATTVRCIIVDNKGGSAYVVPKGSGIIIATGDVSLAASGTETEAVWNGLIISNGKMLLSGGTSTNKGVLRADGSATAKAMQYTCSVGATMDDATDEQMYSVMNFFIGGGEFSMGDSSDAAGAKVDVRNCLSYENWKSE